MLLQRDAEVTVGTAHEEPYLAAPEEADIASEPSSALDGEAATTPQQAGAADGTPTIVQGSEASADPNRQARALAGLARVGYWAGGN